MSERLLRETIREIITSGDASHSAILRTSAVREASFSDWTLARVYARGGRALLTESEQRRGRLLMEGVVQGIINAAKWLGRGVSDGWKSLQKMGKNAIDAAGRAFTMMLEAIPGGKAAFEMIKGFTEDALESASEYIRNAIVEFGEFIAEKKEEILGAIFRGASDPGVLDKIKELKDKAIQEAGEQAKEVEKFFSDLATKPQSALKVLGAARGTLGKVAKAVIRVILSSMKELRSKIANGILQAGGATDSGKLVVRLMTLLSMDMGGEKVLQAASGVWAAIKGLGKTGVNIDHPGREFTDALPDIAQGLISGEGALENIIRSMSFDPKAAVKLLKNVIKMAFNALKKLALGGKGLQKVLQNLNIDPAGKLGRAISRATEETLGLAAGAAGITEGAGRRPRQVPRYRKQLRKGADSHQYRQAPKKKHPARANPPRM